MFAPQAQAQKSFLQVGNLKRSLSTVESGSTGEWSMIQLVCMTRTPSMRISPLAGSSKGPASISTSHGKIQIPKIFRNSLLREF